MKIIERVYIIVFLVIVFSFGVAFFLVEKKEKAIYENRELTQKPTFQLESFIEDEYFKNFETYYLDQFPKRDEIIKIGRIVEYETKKRFSLTKNFMLADNKIDENDYMYKLPNPNKVTNNEEKIKKYTEQINQISNKVMEKGKEVVYINAPYKYTAFQDYTEGKFQIKEMYKTRQYLMKNLDSKIKIIDVNEYFRKELNEEQLKKMFYSTDHHWTYEGSQFAFKHENSIYNQILKEENHLEKLDTQEIKKEEFLGSWSRAVQGVINEKQKIETEILTEEMKKNLELTYWNDGRHKPTRIEVIYGPYFKSRLEIEGKEKIVYGTVTTYDFPEIKIINKNSLSDKKVVVLKDSYFNATILNYARTFRELMVIDPRHLTNETVEERLLKYDYDILVYYYSDNIELTEGFFNLKQKK